jgi:hypothetical protein
VSPKEQKKIQWEIIGRSTDILGVIFAMIEISYGIVALYRAGWRLTDDDLIVLFISSIALIIVWFTIRFITSRQKPNPQPVTTTTIIINYPRRRGCTVTVGKLLKWTIFFLVLFACQSLETASIGSPGFNIGTVAPVIGFLATLIIALLFIASDERTLVKVIIVGGAYLGLYLWTLLLLIGLEAHSLQWGLWAF